MNPSETLEAYLSAWKIEDWFSMAKYLQKTARVHGYGPDKLKREFYDVKLKDFEVTGSERQSDVCEHVSADVVIVHLGKKMDKAILANVIKESKPYEPDSYGIWGVNPLSVQRFNDR